MIRIVLKVVPQAGRQAIVWDVKQKVLKCYLKSAPEKNKANEELIALIAQHLGLNKAAVSIVGGLSSRRKTIALDTQKSAQAIYELLGGSEVGAVQQSLI